MKTVTFDEALEMAIGGSYELPDGRSFWLEVVAVREIMGRVGPVIEAECERRSQQPTNGVVVPDELREAIERYDRLSFGLQWMKEHDAVEAASLKFVRSLLSQQGGDR